MSLNETNSDASVVQWYSSTTRLGLVYIGVELDDAVAQNLQGQHRVLQQAALLADVELSLQALELWQSIALDLIPCQPPQESVLAFEMKPQLLSESRKISVDLPVSALPHLSAKSQELSNAMDITWSDIAVSVALDNFSVSAEELECLEPGSLVLLPASFHEKWQVRIDIQSTTVVAFFNAQNFTVDFPDACQIMDVVKQTPADVCEQTESQAHEVEIKLQNDIMLNVDALLSGSANVALEPLSHEAINEENVLLLVNGAQRFMGSIMRCTGGYAMVLPDAEAQSRFQNLDTAFENAWNE